MSAWGKKPTEGTASPTVDLGRFDTVEERDSWHRWLSHGLDILRVCLRGNDEQRRRIAFKHRPDGPAPLDPESLEARICKAIAVRNHIARELGCHTDDRSEVVEDLDALYHRCAERANRARACILLAESGVLTHWDPPRVAFAPKRANPRRTLTEADHDARAKEADRIAEGMVG